MKDEKIKPLGIKARCLAIDKINTNLIEINRIGGVDVNISRKTDEFISIDFKTDKIITIEDKQILSQVSNIYINSKNYNQGFTLNQLQLPLEVVKFMFKGREVVGYKFLSTPPLIEISNVTNQIITIDKALLDYKTKSIKKNELIELFIKHSKAKINSNVTFSSIYKVFRIGKNKARDEKKAIEDSKKVLDHLVKEKFIKRYKIEENKISLVRK